MIKHFQVTPMRTYDVRTLKLLHDEMCLLKLLIITMYSHVLQQTKCFKVIFEITFVDTEQLAETCKKF